MALPSGHGHGGVRRGVVWSMTGAPITIKHACMILRRSRGSRSSRNVHAGSRPSLLGVKGYFDLSRNNSRSRTRPRARPRTRTRTRTRARGPRTEPMSQDSAFSRYGQAPAAVEGGRTPAVMAHSGVEGWAAGPAGTSKQPLPWGDAEATTQIAKRFPGGPGGTPAGRVTRALEKQARTSEPGHGSGVPEDRGVHTPEASRGQVLALDHPVDGGALPTLDTPAGVPVGE